MNALVIPVRSMPALIFQRWIRSKVPMKLPEAPPESACCGQGCSNCVWLDYGEKNKEKVLRDLEQKVPDPNIRAFVLTELKMKWRGS